MVTFHDIEWKWTARHPHSWILDYSNDGSEWAILDERRKISQLDGPDRTATFAISNPTECRYIRLTNTGQSTGGNFCLELHAFEVFGTLLE
jgi:hypothetical protein